MRQILIHGLGQTPDSWNKVVANMEGTCTCPDLPAMLKGKDVNYTSLYQGFVSYCEMHTEPLSLCGLSLGGILALNYALDYSERVHSLALIGVQYQMPVKLLKVQNAMFHLMPRSMFQQMGFGKESFIQLCRSMMTLDFSRELDKITCPVLIICGEKDKANRKAAEELAQFIPGAELQIMLGAGHEVNTEAPEQLADALCAFYGMK